MRSHSHEVDQDRELRPKADRIESEDTGLMYRAAATGRTDVLGPAGLLGLQRVVGNAGVAGMQEQDRSPVFTRRQPPTVDTATATRLAALCLAAEADAREANTARAEGRRERSRTPDAALSSNAARMLALQRGAGNKAVQRMLVALMDPTWSPDDAKIISDKKQALAKAQGQQLKDENDILNLGAEEPLWLYSHGSRNEFGGKSARDLVDWLVNIVRMPPGKREVTLKGCKTGGVRARSGASHQVG